MPENPQGESTTIDEFKPTHCVSQTHNPIDSALPWCNNAVDPQSKQMLLLMVCSAGEFCNFEPFDFNEIENRIENGI